jgi:hypothetical protein
MTQWKTPKREEGSQTSKSERALPSLLLFESGNSESILSAWGDIRIIFFQYRSILIHIELVLGMN